mmetsp:Transcript_14104/g.18465  ORF Transcript_14104/g.18465 Transcript_14104/m.18465 type:complete len:251 (-) Transcript_14104:41-793(-)
MSRFLNTITRSLSTNGHKSTPLTLAFDMYGTVFDVSGLRAMLQSVSSIGKEKEPHLNSLWRSKQLEYTFRRATMNQYLPMSCCTRDALDYSCNVFKAQVSESEKDALCSAYRSLPCFPDCRQGLSLLKNEGHRIFAFSNGTRDDICSLLSKSELQELFDGVVVVDDMEKPTFKPDPRVYEYFLNETEACLEQTWLISSNSFDIIGAGECGWNTMWMHRDPKTVFDTWSDGHKPTGVAKSMNEISDMLRNV